MKLANNISETIAELFGVGHRADRKPRKSYPPTQLTAAEWKRRRYEIMAWNQAVEDKKQARKDVQRERRLARRLFTLAKK